MLSRPRLLTTLNQALNARLTLLVAPPGYGKTMLLREWAQEQADRVLWLALGELDNDPAHLLQSLLVNLRTHGEVTFTPDTSSPLAYSLAQLFAQAPRPPGGDWLLVLDDYHLINNPAIHQALDTVLGLPAWPVHLMMTSRNQPPLTMTARLRVEGRLAELNEADLRFNLAEARALFGGSGLDPTESDLVGAVERTEGWPVALELLRQAAQHEPAADLRAILTRISDERPLFDYLAGQVLERQSESIQDFLRRTSLLPYLSAELCNAYLEITNAAGLLDELEREHLFIFRLDEAQGRRYRYHALFQEFLNQCLEQKEGAAMVNGWHRRAAACLLAHQATPPPIDDQAAAVAHLLAANDWMAAAQVIAALADALDFGSLPRLEPWFARLPTEVQTIYQFAMNGIRAI